MDRDDPAYRGQRDYNRLLLRLYDPLVVGHVGRIVWRCPTSRLVERYREHIRDRHLDIGPGTGYFIDCSGLPSGSRGTSGDQNPNVLTHAARRLGHYEVTGVEAAPLKPLPVEGPFDSAALHLVLHCLPGPIDRKAAGVANVAAVLAPTGVFFGATVLGTSAAHTRLSRVVLGAFNRQGGFDNLGDSEEALHGILAESFNDVEVDVVGTVALFVARSPRARAGLA